MLFATAVLGIGAVAWLGISHAGANSTPPANGLPSPTVLPATTLTAPLDYPDSGISLEPPGSQTASFSAADAIAWSSDHEACLRFLFNRFWLSYPPEVRFRRTCLSGSSGIREHAFPPSGRSAVRDRKTNAARNGMSWWTLTPARLSTLSPSSLYRRPRYRWTLRDFNQATLASSRESRRACRSVPDRRLRPRIGVARLEPGESDSRTDQSPAAYGGAG